MPKNAAYVREIQAIGAVPQILATVASITDIGFVAIAHVTETSWHACALLDRIAFGMQIGDSLEVATTLCDEVRSSGEAIFIDSVRDSERYRDHHTPRQYGFQSYFATPIFRVDGSYFGTLCGLDPRPLHVSAPATVATLQLFAQLIGRQLDAARDLADTRSALLSEREGAELREQFIAVLGHDLRTPLGAIQSNIDLARLQFPEPALRPLLGRMERSVGHMASLVDDVLDFTRGRMGGGIGLALRRTEALDRTLRQVIDELAGIHPEARIAADISAQIDLHCDAGRIAQLLSNLVKNAIVHGTPGGTVDVAVRLDGARFTIAVANDGGHLAQATIDQLFKPFRRGAADAGHDGLGLGLYIVNEIAQSHGGAMHVASHDGRITFTFSMPASS